MPLYPRAPVRAPAMRARPQADSDSSKKEEGAEGAMHEAREGPEEETREGAADGQAPGRRKRAFGGPDRKRRAKGSEKTGPAMKDAASGGCGCSGKAGTCDGNCSGKAGAKRGDALTAPEYLAACDLGIQDRSRTYIRARLDAAAARQDLKCGRGSISKGEKCTKGAAQAVQAGPSGAGRPGKFGKQSAGRVAQVVGIAGQLGTLGGALKAATTGDTKKFARLMQANAGFTTVTAAGMAATGETKKARDLLTNAAITGTGASLLSGDLGRAASAGRRAGRGLGMVGKRGAALPGNLKGRAKLARIASKRPKGKAKIGPDGKIQSPWLDSVYAPGFTPDMAELAI